MLWTKSVLHAARHIYKEQGFELIGEQHHSFGADLLGQNQEFQMQSPGRPDLAKNR